MDIYIYQNKDNHTHLHTFQIISVSKAMEADRFLVFSKDEFTVLFLKESIDGQDEDESWKMRRFGWILAILRTKMPL